MSRLSGNRDRIINTDGELKCPRCKKMDRIMAWERFTQADCTNREKKRAYVSLSTERAYKKIDRRTLYYRCPNCGEYIEGFRLKPLYSEELG